MLEVAIVTGSPDHVKARTPAVPAARRRPLPPEVVTLRPPPTGLPGTVALPPRTRSSGALAVGMRACGGAGGHVRAWPAVWHTRRRPNESNADVFALHHPGTGNLQLRRRRADLCVRDRPGTPRIHAGYTVTSTRGSIRGATGGM